MPRRNKRINRKNNKRRRNAVSLLKPLNPALGRTTVKVLMVSANINSVITTGNYLFDSTNAYYNLFTNLAAGGDYAAMVSDWRLVRVSKIQVRFSPVYRLATTVGSIPYQPVMISYQPSRVSITAQSDVAINENALVLNLNRIEDTLYSLPLVSLTAPVTINGFTYCLDPTKYTDTLFLQAFPGCLVLNSNSSPNQFDIPLFTVKFYFELHFANPR